MKRYKIRETQNWERGGGSTGRETWLDAQRSEDIIDLFESRHGDALESIYYEHDPDGKLNSARFHVPNGNNPYFLLVEVSQWEPLTSEERKTNMLKSILDSLDVVDDVLGEGSLIRGGIDGAFISEGGLRGAIEKIREVIHDVR